MLPKSPETCTLMIAIARKSWFKEEENFYFKFQDSYSIEGIQVKQSWKFHQNSSTDHWELDSLSEYIKKL